MAVRCLLYYITDRSAFPGDEHSRRRHLLEKISEAARAGVDFIQLREKDLTPRDLESLGREAMRIILENALPTDTKELAAGHWPLTTALLINSRTDVALAVEADGVHLRSDDISPQEVREIWRKTHVRTAAREISPLRPVIGVSCHSPTDVAQAAANSATFSVFAPIFEKKVFEKNNSPDTRLTGLALLSDACKANIPVLALGGVTLFNASSCLEAGAAGIAGIRLFQANDVAEVVRRLR